MKKITLFIAAAAFISFGAFAQIKRIVLIEQFTSSTCGPCNPGNKNVTSELAQDRGDFIMVKYQMSWPGSGDPYYNDDGGLTRRSYYSVSSVPNLWVDGMLGINSNDFTNKMFKDAAAEAAHVEFNFTKYNYNPSTEEVNVEVEIIPDADNSSPMLRLYVAVVEGRTYQNKGSNGETSFGNVFMDFMGDVNGDNIGSLKSGEKITKSFSRGMDTTFVEDIDDLIAVVWIQDLAKKEVLNAGFIDLRDSKFVGVEEAGSLTDLSVYPNPFRDVATVEFNLETSTTMQINVFDVTGKVVQSVPTTEYSAGNTKINIDGSNLNNGLYYVNIVTDSGITSRKIVLNR